MATCSRAAASSTRSRSLSASSAAHSMPHTALHSPEAWSTARRRAHVEVEGGLGMPTLASRPPRGPVHGPNSCRTAAAIPFGAVTVYLRPKEVQLSMTRRLDGRLRCSIGIPSHASRLGAQDKRDIVPA
jgi:hypothetical protein